MYNIFDLNGPEFLLLFLGVETSAVVAAAIVRTAVLSVTKKSRGDTPLDHYDIAYLRGGSEHVFLTAVATMSHQNKVLIDAKQKTISLREKLNGPAHAVEKVIETAVWTKPNSLKTAFDCVKPTLEHLRTKLEKLGLVPTEGQEVLCRAGSAAVAFLPVLVLAIPKIGIGIGRDRPVAFLVLLALIASGIAIAYLIKRPWTTNRGQRKLAQWQSQRNALRTNLSYNPAGMGYADLAMAYALFGALAVGVLDPYNAARGALRPVQACSSGSGCGGSSCGGGGCGGGGCGGCGG